MPVEITNRYCISTIGTVNLGIMIWLKHEVKLTIINITGIWSRGSVPKYLALPSCLSLSTIQFANADVLLLCTTGHK
jgi:hypothetical protein